MSNSQKLVIITLLILGIGGGTVTVYELRNSSLKGTTDEKNEATEGQGKVIPASKEYSTLTTNNQDKRLSALETKIDSLQSRLDAMEVKPITMPLSNEALSAEPQSEEQLTRVNFGANFRPSSITNNLIEVGIDPLIAEEIEAKRNKMELARLVLRDKAIRGEYLRTDQYQEELKTLNESQPSLREEIGDDFYDRFLYTSGQANRILISSVMTGSAADGAGMLNGDLLTSYAGQRLFQGRELRGLTTGGLGGEIIDVRVIRDGNEISLNMPRGPLGVRLNQKRVDPDPS